MKQNIRQTSPRTIRSKRGHQDLRPEPLRSVSLDTSQGFAGVFHQVCKVICKQISGITKSKDTCLAFINTAVTYLGKTSCEKVSEDIKFISSNEIDENYTNSTTCDHSGREKYYENWEDVGIKEKYFNLFRCVLLNKSKEIRVAGLRFLRYVIKTENDVMCLIKTNSVPLLVRCIDICIDNHNERIHGIRLVRHLLHIAPELFPKSLARCLIAIARDGTRERDKLLRSSQAVLNELAIFNPQVFIECGGVSSTLYGVLDCSMPRINEALMSSLLFLLNDPDFRHSCSQFHLIMAPFSDVHYKHHEFDIEYSKSEERELRIEASCYALLAAFRSWPGLITLYQPKDQTMKALIDLLRLPTESTREMILDFLYDLLRIQIGKSHADYDEALQERATMRPPDQDDWRLYEGFVVAESRMVLNHIAKFRPNLIQNYFSLILYVLLKKDLPSSLCEVIITASQPVSIKATILLGEILYLSDQNLPDCGMMSHALPVLSEKAACSNGEERLKASQAITALLKLSRMHLCRRSSVKGMSLYLANIIEGSKDDMPGGAEFGKISKWLCKDHDDQIQQVLKTSGVFGKGLVASWNWSLLIPVLRWPSSALIALEETSYRLLIEKLLNYFKPSSKLFSKVEATHTSALPQAEALLVFVDFLLQISYEDQDRYLNELLNDINVALKKVACEKPCLDAYLSPSHLSITVCQYYFLAIGRLSRSPKGYELVHKAGIFHQMLLVIEKSESDVYAKLFATTLDYSLNGLNRNILSKILTNTKECSRMYATKLLRVFIRAGVRDFARWGVDMLVRQLYDESRLVSISALYVLDEALDDEEYLEAMLNNPPSVQHLGDNGQLLLAKLVASPQGFRTYHECNFISSLLDKWASNFNLKYVKLMQMALSESLTHLQRGNDGRYGRRTGSKHVVHDVYVLPHLYGSLTLHKEGFSLLMQHEYLSSLKEILRERKISTIQDTIKLKSAIWAFGHLGRSCNGVNFLSSNNLVSCLVDLAATCPVYSVRGTVFNALCLIASTWEGANILQKHGWESVRRHHHEHLWASTERESWLGRVDDPLLDSKKFGAVSHHHQPSESDLEDHQEGPKFYFMDESDEDEEDQPTSFSFIIDGFNDESTSTDARKSQTLPHDSKPPSYVGHQRSFSDCAPVIEDPTGSSPHPSSQDSSLSKRGSRLKNKILSSFKRRSSKIRNSVGSRTSNSSSSSEKMFSFLNPSRRRKRGKSFSSSGREDDFDSTQSQSCTDDEITLEDGDIVPRAVPKLSPIASGTSLSGGDRAVENCRILTSCTEKKNKYQTLSPPPQSSMIGYGFYKMRSLGMHPHRRVSESSHEELQSKNSLRDFLTPTSYEQTTHSFTRGITRSPSGCSELSSVRSFGALCPRGGSSNWLTSRGREGTITPCIDDADLSPPHPSGLRYMGLTIPVDVNRLLLDTTSLQGEWDSEEMDNKNSFNVIVDGSLPLSAGTGGGEMKCSYSPERKAMMDTEESLALEFHKEESCLRCYSIVRNPGNIQRDSERNKTETKGAADTLYVDKGNGGGKVGKKLMTADSIRRVSDDGVERKTTVNRFLVRKQILKFVNNLSTTFIAKTSESGLLALKAKLPWAFQDVCLYAEICVLLSSYSYRLNARRFIQELFLDLAFKEVFEDAHQILREDEMIYKNFGEELVSFDYATTRSGNVIHTEIPEYMANEFEGFDFDGPTS